MPRLRRWVGGGVFLHHHDGGKRGGEVGVFFEGLEVLIEGGVAGAVFEKGLVDLGGLSWASLGLLDLENLCERSGFREDEDFFWSEWARVEPKIIECAVEVAVVMSSDSEGVGDQLAAVVGGGVMNDS